MEKLLFTATILFALGSCKTKKTVAENLPKDISEKPQREASLISQENEQKSLSALYTEIQTLSASETCTNAENWRISPIGSKSCGGPQAYLAYPIKVENEILPKIADYTARQAAFNRKYGLISDCAMVMPPSGIRCEAGKAVLISSSADAREAAY